MTEQPVEDDAIAIAEWKRGGARRRAERVTFGREQARYLVDAYYAMQDFRIQADGEVRADAVSPQPIEILELLAGRFRFLEDQLRAELGAWAARSEVGEWSLGVYGIGPVLAAGLLAHIDIERAPTVGHIWRFAGLDPTVRWEPKTKRPYNAKLKVLCWKIGDSFVKLSGPASGDKCFYGRVYRERKAVEIERNEAGLFTAQAAASLERRRITDRDLRATYEAGLLPAGRLDLRARRYAVKLFLSHWHHVAYRERYGEDPPKPYVLTQEGGHAHFIEPPGWEPRSPERTEEHERAVLRESTALQERAVRVESTGNRERAAESAVDRERAVR